MKSIRILIACTLAVFASVSLVRADEQCKKNDAPACEGCPAQKKEVAKCEKDKDCSAGACTKTEKTETPKSA